MLGPSDQLGKAPDSVSTNKDTPKRVGYFCWFGPESPRKGVVQPPWSRCVRGFGPRGFVVLATGGAVVGPCAIELSGDPSVECSSSRNVPTLSFAFGSTASARITTSASATATQVSPTTRRCP